MFTPIRTDRLLVRPFVLDDTAGLAARRNDPEVARLQNWELPYPLQRAEKLVSGLVAMEGPSNDEWWMAVVADGETGEVLGDLALHLTWQGRTAEVGYTLAREHWGKGYATEALEALIEYLFDQLGVTRVFGMLHPDNVASAMVLERCGLLFEGHTRSSFWLGDEVSDDWIYGMTRPDWETWRDRPRHPPEAVGLVEVTPENERIVSKLATHKTQEAFVAPMCWSFADALFPEVVDGAPVVPWMRAVVADEEFVGFVMLALRTEHHPEPYLWRLLIDRLHQRRGIGGRVLELVAEECRGMGDGTLLTSWEEGRGSPRPFYLRHGFEPTGKIVDEETEARKQL
ncbi:MAG TPA: GNAT family N-acetyltransferase [Acidimicrobiia bacterium]|nr:GNAT family N-acetyltransferase [Acidimicrobiia bacterium]